MLAARFLLRHDSFIAKIVDCRVIVVAVGHGVGEATAHENVLQLEILPVFLFSVRLHCLVETSGEKVHALLPLIENGHVNELIAVGEARQAHVQHLLQVVELLVFGRALLEARSLRGRLLL